ncbi:DUF2336 domain-containing protein [Methylorubrum zatmanii]|uniref:DUF2336 domain-containing protein n=1 Tax=Methylorubrum zatmanii TaxID=29429 RepID=A0ABW1WMU3_9HYPH|nr:DUF2336 domain-containing protein [Methylorubrum zatmanii]MBD8909024.1 hypothetical protein [Methylorubrum zatmanii]
MSSSVADAPDLSGLIELSRDPAIDLKPVILRVQTDLFLAAPVHDRAILQAFESLAAGLIPTVDAETVRIVAEKLGGCPDVPAAVRAALEARGFPVDPPREPESEAEADHALAENPGALIGTRTLERLLARARSDADLARTLLARPDIPPADLAPLWLHAGPEQRRAIAAAVEVTAALRPCPRPPRTLATTLVERSHGRDIQGFITALGEGLGLPENYLGAASDPTARYDLLTLALRTADLREGEAVFIFLTLNDTVARSVDRVFSLVTLFRETDRATARDLLCAILGAPVLERAGGGEYQPFHGPEAKRSAASSERGGLRPALPSRLRRTS